MSSPAWNGRRWAQRQRLRRRPIVLALRKIDIPWPPKVGQLVCDCRYQHRPVVRIDVKFDDVILDDGYSCSLDMCIGPVDHYVADHPAPGDPWPAVPDA